MRRIYCEGQSVVSEPEDELGFSTVGPSLQCRAQAIQNSGVHQNAETDRRRVWFLLVVIHPNAQRGVSGIVVDIGS